jgi:hypothetical protein
MAIMAEPQPISRIEKQGYTHVACHCRNCGYTAHVPFSMIRSLNPALPVSQMTLEQLREHMHCGRCPGRRRPDTIAPWRQDDAAGHTSRPRRT